MSAIEWPVSTIGWLPSTTRSPRSLMVRICIRSVTKATYSASMCLEGKQARVVIQQVAIDIDEVKRGYCSIRNIASGCADSTILAGNQLRQELPKWLSPPDPSINHNLACGAHHKRDAEWFLQGSIFAEWKSIGSLLWLHGKRMLLSVF